MADVGSGSDWDGLFASSGEENDGGAEPIQGSASFSDKNDATQATTLAHQPQPQYTRMVCFTDYVEAIPLPGKFPTEVEDALNGDYAHYDLGEFPEDPPTNENYAVLIALDCIVASHVEETLSTWVPKELNPNALSTNEVQERKALLQNLLVSDQMWTVYLLCRMEGVHFGKWFNRYHLNELEIIDVVLPSEGAQETRISTGIEEAIRAESPLVLVATTPMDDVGTVSDAGLPEIDMPPFAIAALTEVISFNHIPDAGGHDPTDDGNPPMPPLVPIFPLDGFEEDTSHLTEEQRAALTRYETESDDVTERFVKDEAGRWIHEGTGYYTKEFWSCWLDDAGEPYRLYADPKNPREIRFFKLGSGTNETPPQSPLFTKDNEPSFEDIPQWWRVEIPPTMA